MECPLANITVHYEVFGEGRPLIALHGWEADHRFSVGALEPIFEKRSGWKRIYPDLPGRGKSPGADWITCQDQVLQVILDFIDNAIPGKRFALAGMSYGGYTAQGVVCRRAELMDGLLLTVPTVERDQTAPVLTAPPPIPLLREPNLTEQLNPDELAIFREFEEDLIIQNRTVIQRLKTVIGSQPLQIDEAFLTRLRSSQSGTKFSFKTRTLPQPFERPTLILTGRQDKNKAAGYRNVMGILENYPRATFAVLDCAGHCLEYEQETLYRALVGEWLDRMEAAPTNQG